MGKKPTVGVALGSGGARGFAHLGVLKMLVEHNIPIHCVAGSSMGALIGAFFAAGLEMEQMYKLAKVFKRKYYLDFTVPKMGFVTGNRVKELIKAFTKNKKIEELSIPLSIVATDLNEGKKVVFSKGSVAEAVRASISIPGIFVPVQIDGMLLVDGGVVDRVPVSVAKDMGADIVIAVDVSDVKRNEKITSIFDVIMQSLDIMQDELVHHRKIASDIMIRPKVEQFSSRAFTNIEEILKKGEEEAEKHVDEIKERIQKWEEEHENRESLD